MVLWDFGRFYFETSLLRGEGGTYPDRPRGSWPSPPIPGHPPPSSPPVGAWPRPVPTTVSEVVGGSEGEGVIMVGEGVTHSHRHSHPSSPFGGGCVAPRWRRAPPTGSPRTQPSSPSGSSAAMPTPLEGLSGSPRPMSGAY